MIEKLRKNKLLEMIIVVLLIIVSLKKGGFYKSDVIAVQLVITALGFIYLLFEIVLGKKDETSIFSILFILMGISYALPIIFKQSSDLSDSIFEMIRYFNMYLIYRIVRNSKYKKIYINGIILVTLLQCLIGIDGIGNRYLANILSKVHSGFLEKDFTRMSGTIQYANVFALLCAISILLIWFQLKKRETITIYQKIIDGFLLFLFHASLILSESRAVIILLYCSLMIDFIDGKRKKKVWYHSNVFLCNIFLSLLYTALVYNFALFSGKIYIMTGIGYIVVLIANKILDCVKWGKFSGKKVIIGAGIGIFLYSILASCITAPLKMTGGEKNPAITRNLYFVNKEGINQLNFQVKEQEEDTRYTIQIVQVDEDLQSTLVEEINYFQSVTGTYHIEFMPVEKLKYVKVSINCSKGKMVVEDMYFNNKNCKLNYVLVPSSLVFRIEDILHHSTSFSDRIIYVKDSISIITSHVKNFLIGVGGEGFKNTYELYQTTSYVSTEAHNVFLQIFIESGVIGFGVFMGICILSLLKGKNIEGKIVIGMILVHSLVDLNFSYFLMMFLFAILCGVLVEGDRIEKKGILLLKGATCIPIMMLFILLLKANIAYGTQIPRVENKKDLKEIVNLINQSEKRVMLDPYDINYRMELNDAYQNYFQLLREMAKDKTLQEEFRNVAQNMQDNLDKMVSYSPNNKYVIFAVSDCYFKNFVYFSQLKYGENVEEGYESYLKYIFQLLENIQKTHSKNEVAQNGVKVRYQRYTEELKEKNKKLNSLTIQQLLEQIE